MAVSEEAFRDAAIALGSAAVAGLIHRSPLTDHEAPRCKVAACTPTAARSSADAGKLAAVLSAWMATVSTGCRWMFPAQTRAWHHQVQAERRSACIIVCTMLFGGLAMKGAAHLNFGMMHEAAIPARAWKPPGMTNRRLHRSSMTGHPSRGASSIAGVPSEVPPRQRLRPRCSAG